MRHEYYVKWICNRLQEKGFATKTNKLSGADIKIPKLNLTIEIELGKSNMDG